MGARQIAEAQEKLTDDLPTGEPEGLLEELDPVRLLERVVRVEPAGEGAMGLADLLQTPGVLDGRLDLQPVADDARIGEQPALLLRAIGRHLVDVEAVEGDLKGLPLLQDGEPGEAGLIDLEDEALEEHIVIARRKAVLALVVGSMEGMAGGDVAIGRHGLNAGR